MLVKLERVAFYYFKPNTELLYYYATTDILTFSGIATPELALVLYEFLDCQKPFEIKFEQRRDGSYKLIELLQRPIHQEHSQQASQLIEDQQLIPFSPKQVSFYKHTGLMRAAVKSYNTSTFFGNVTEEWVKWLLANIRRKSEVLLTIEGRDFLMNSERVTDEEYLDRREATYLDNKERFFFANESLTLRQSEYLKNEKPVFSSE